MVMNSRRRWIFALPPHFPNGSAALPAVTFLNETDHGMYVIPGATSSLRLAAGGVDRIVLSDDGTLGWTDISGRGTGGVAFYSAGLKMDINNSRVSVKPHFGLTEVATPGTPPAGEYFTYPKTGDSNLYGKNDAGLESRLSNFIVCTSGTRPATPIDGMQIYETDTFKTYIYIAAKTGWFPPWNTAWGNLARQTITSDSIAYTASGNSDMALLAFAARADRDYRVHVHSPITVNAVAVWDFNLTVGGTAVGQIGWAGGNTLGELINGSVLWQPATTTTYDLRVAHVEGSGTATLTYRAALGTKPRQLIVEDVGPRT